MSCSSWRRCVSAFFLVLFRGEQIREVLRRCIEKGNEVLQRRLERRQEHGPKLLLAGHRGELLLDRFAIEDLALDDPGLYAELLVLFAKIANDLRSCRGVLIAPGDAGHPDQRVLERRTPLEAFEGLLNQSVLDDTVVHARLTESRAELVDVFDLHAL